MHTQKFNRGDLVHVAKDQGPGRAHFESDVDAVVLGTYLELHDDGLGDEELPDDQDFLYVLFLKNYGSVAWYPESTLTLLETNRIDLARQWRRKGAARL